ncbi:MAG: CGNR zinc finger domain-containing protein [Bryobacteraceae bacterium]|jgi:predicted RNA-binding Zn ribbon-like protein
MAFQLIAGHPALDLVNTLDWRFRKNGVEELLKTYADLLRFTEQLQLLSPMQARELQWSAGEETLVRCRELREALAETFYGRVPSAQSRRTLERYFKAALLEQKLSWKHSPHLEWSWPGGPSHPDLPLWTLAMSAADLMTSEAVDRVRACDNPECRWLFLDTSKNHTRRWCDMKLCGNRMKARRFKAQRKA